METLSPPTKYDDRQIAELGTHLLAAWANVNPSFIVDPAAHRRCVEEAVRMIDEAVKIAAELNNTPNPTPA